MRAKMLPTLGVLRITRSKGGVTAAEQKQLKGIWDPNLTYATLHLSHNSVSQRLKKTLIAPVSEPREERLHFIQTKGMHLKALKEECRALVLSLKRVNWYSKELTVSKQHSQVEREHQIPQS